MGLSISNPHVQSLAAAAALVEAASLPPKPCHIRGFAIANRASPYGTSTHSWLWRPGSSLRQWGTSAPMTPLQQPLLIPPPHTSTLPVYRHKQTLRPPLHVSVSFLAVLSVRSISQQTQEAPGPGVRWRGAAASPERQPGPGTETPPKAQLVVTMSLITQSFAKPDV